MTFLVCSLGPRPPGKEGLARGLILFQILIDSVRQGAVFVGQMDGWIWMNECLNLNEMTNNESVSAFKLLGKRRGISICRWLLACLEDGDFEPWWMWAPSLIFVDGSWVSAWTECSLFQSWIWGHQQFPVSGKDSQKRWVFNFCHTIWIQTFCVFTPLVITH